MSKMQVEGKQVTYAVTVTLPKGVGPCIMQAFIREALQVYCKSTDPDSDPLFDLDAHPIIVNRLIPPE